MMKILGISLPTKSEIITQVHIDFAKIDEADLPDEIHIKEYRNGKCSIEMNSFPIPSLCGEYDAEWKAKRAILDWIDKAKQDEVVNTITVGKAKPESKPPTSE